MLRLEGSKWDVVLTNNRTQLVALFYQMIFKTFGLTSANVELRGISLGSVVFDFVLIRNADEPLPDAAIVTLFSTNTTVESILRLYTDITGETSEGIIGLSIAPSYVDDSCGQSCVMGILIGMSFVVVLSVIATTLAVVHCYRRKVCWWGSGRCGYWWRHPQKVGPTREPPHVPTACPAWYAPPVVPPSPRGSLVSSIADSSNTPRVDDDLPFPDGDWSTPIPRPQVPRRWHPSPPTSHEPLFHLLRAQHQEDESRQLVEPFDESVASVHKCPFQREGSTNTSEDEEDDERRRCMGVYDPNEDLFCVDLASAVRASEAQLDVPEETSIRSHPQSLTTDATEVSEVHTNDAEEYPYAHAEEQQQHFGVAYRRSTPSPIHEFPEQTESSHDDESDDVIVLNSSAGSPHYPAARSPSPASLTPAGDREGSPRMDLPFSLRRAQYASWKASTPNSAAVGTDVILPPTASVELRGIAQEVSRLFDDEEEAVFPESHQVHVSSSFTTAPMDESEGDDDDDDVYITGVTHREVVVSDGHSSSLVVQPAMGVIHPPSTAGGDDDSAPPRFRFVMPQAPPRTPPQLSDDPPRHTIVDVVELDTVASSSDAQLSDVIPPPAAQAVGYASTQHGSSRGGTNHPGPLRRSLSLMDQFPFLRIERSTTPPQSPRWI